MRVQLIIATALAALAIICSFVSAAVVNHLGEKTQKDALFYPEKLHHRYLITDEEKNIESYIEYFKDDFTRVVAEIKYKNGKIRYLYYREKLQTLAKVLDYRTDEATGKHHLVAESYLTEDGKKLTQHMVYRVDGTLERKGERQVDGKYKTVYYAADGVAVSVVKVFDKREDLFEETGFYLDGTKKFTTEWNLNYLVTKYYKHDGSNISVVENHHGFQRGLFYAKDGKTPMVSFSKNNENTELIYFDDKQNPVYKVTYYPDRIVVDVIRKGRVIYAQTLVPIDPSKEISHCTGGNRLLKVAEISEKSMMPYMQIIDRLFILPDDGEKPVQVVVPLNGKGNAIYNLDANGIVIGIEYEDIEDGKTVDVSENRYKLGDRVDYNPDIFVQNKFECVEIPEKVEVPQLRVFSY